GASAGTTGSTPGTTTVPPVLPVNPTTPRTPSTPAPSGLASTEAYHVSLEISTRSGGVQPIDPLTRDTKLPSASQPLLVELGVLKGGKRVLFAVQPGAVLSGPGACIPGPVDCEIISLAIGHTESVTQ